LTLSGWYEAVPDKTSIQERRQLSANSACAPGCNFPGQRVLLIMVAENANQALATPEVLLKSNKEIDSKHFCIYIGPKGTRN
jgi:hypothetical protein